MITVLSTFGHQNASVRARILDPLQKLGVNFTHVPYFRTSITAKSGFLSEPCQIAKNEMRLRNLEKISKDCVIVNREVSPISRGNLEARVLHGAGRGLYFIDDALFLDSARSAPTRIFSKARKATIAAISADVVVAGNEFLASWASEYAKDVRVIPTCVDTTLYRRKRIYDIGESPRLVWLGTESGLRYLKDISDALVSLHRQRNLTLTVISSKTASIPSKLRHMTDLVPWRQGISHVSLAEYDAGIMPLKSSEYERGKCAYKILEYGAAALPVIASPVGENIRILKSSGNPAPKLGEWEDAILGLLSASAQARERLGSRLRRIVETRYDYSVHLNEYQQLLEDCWR